MKPPSNIKYPILTIDPGVNIGMALFWKEHTKPIWTNCIQATQTNDWILNHQVVLNAFEVEIKSFKSIQHIYIEQPKFMESHMGMTAARSNSLFKLICVYGAMMYIMRRNSLAAIYEIDTNWKGNLDKKKLADRIKRKHNLEFPDHVCDAVGLGLWLKGIF